MNRPLIPLLAVLAMLSVPALATPKPKDVPAQPAAAPVTAPAPVKAAEKKAPGAKPVRSASPATAQYGKAVREMSLNLKQRMSGEPDRDFVTMLLPVQQGAADMAKVEAANGKDPALRRLAEEIVKARTSENKQMRDWLAAHPYKAEQAAASKAGK